MNSPCRVQLSRKAGWRKPPNTVLVSRPFKFGNPWPWQIVGKAVAVAQFQDWLHTTDEGRAVLAAAHRELAGKNLACWCRLDEPCHADVLLAELQKGVVA